MHASTTGCYENEVFHYDHPDLVTIQMALKNAGYKAYGAGKIYHHRSGYVDLRGWDQYFTRSLEPFLRYISFFRYGYLLFQFMLFLYLMSIPTMLYDDA